MVRLSATTQLRRIAIVLAVLALVFTAALFAIGALTPSTASGSPVQAEGVQTSEAFLEAVDYISSDGHYVKLGDVEISTTGIVTRD